MNQIEIINLKKYKPKEFYDVIVDRSSVLGNPFPLNKESDRNEVCNKYEEHINNTKDEQILNKIKDIKEIYDRYGKLRLFCWCSPKRCRAESIKQLILKGI